MTFRMGNAAHSLLRSSYSSQLVTSTGMSSSVITSTVYSLTGMLVPVKSVCGAKFRLFSFAYLPPPVMTSPDTGSYPAIQ